MFSRSDNFCLAFSRLATLQSVLPNHVNVLALTIISTQETFTCVVDHLVIKDVAVIGLHPGKSNN